MKKSSVLKEIALELNISVNTVSRALRDCSDISENTKKRVRQKAIEMGYIQNSLSRLLNDMEKYLIAIIVESFDNLYYMSFVQSFIENSRDTNYDYMVLPIDKHGVDEETIKQCISQRVSFIITLVQISDKAIEFCQLNNIGVCAVGFDIGHPYCSSVFPNHKQQVSLGANYLKEHGAKDVVFVSKTDSKSENKRFSILESEWQAISPDGLVKWLTFEKMNQIVKECKKSGVGIFCYNDEVAYRVVEWSKEALGASFDENFLNIVGVDGLAEKICGLVDITSVHSDFKEMISVIKTLISKTTGGSETRVQCECEAFLHLKKSDLSK